MDSAAWYPRYVGDYMRDTGHLSLEEDGAYNRLLDHYYATSKPLPSDAAGLYRICRACTPTEQAAVDRVASEFFDARDGQLHNTRADKEIAKRVTISEARAMAGRKGALTKWQNKADGKPMANARTKGVAKGVANRCTTTTTATTTEKQPNPEPREPPLSPRGDAIATEFEAVWKDYPDKSGKAKALAAYKKARKNGTTAEDVAEGLARYLAYVEARRRDGFDLRYKNGSTWFHNREWESEWTVAAAPKRSGFGRD